MSPKNRLISGKGGVTWIARTPNLAQSLSPHFRLMLWEKRAWSAFYCVWASDHAPLCPLLTALSPGSSRGQERGLTAGWGRGGSGKTFVLTVARAPGTGFLQWQRLTADISRAANLWVCGGFSSSTLQTWSLLLSRPQPAPAKLSGHRCPWKTPWSTIWPNNLRSLCNYSDPWFQIFQLWVQIV